MKYDKSLNNVPSFYLSIPTKLLHTVPFPPIFNVPFYNTVYTSSNKAVNRLTCIIK